MTRERSRRKQVLEVLDVRLGVEEAVVQCIFSTERGLVYSTVHWFQGNGRTVQ